MDEFKNKFNKKAVVTIAGSHTLNDIFSSFYAPLIPFLTEKLGFSYSLAGFLSVVEKAPSLLNPLLGIILDSFPLRWFLIISPLITSLMMGMIGLVSTKAMLAMVLMLSGFSGAIYHISAPVVMRDVSGKRIGTGMSFFMFGGEIARTLGPMSIVAAVSRWGLEGTWRLIPVGVVGVIIIYLNIHRIPNAQHHAKHKKNRDNLVHAVKKMKPLFFIIAPMLLFRAFSKTALTLFLPSYLVDQGMSAVHAGYALALLEAFAAVGVLSAGMLSDALGRKSILVVIMSTTPVLMFLFTYSDGWVRMFLIALMGIVFFASTPVFMAMVHDMNSTFPALANGFFMMISFAMSSIVSIIVGFLGDKIGLWETYRVTAFLSAGALPFSLMINSRKRRL